MCHGMKAWQTVGSSRPIEADETCGEGRHWLWRENDAYPHSHTVSGVIAVPARQVLKATLISPVERHGGEHKKDRD